MQPSNSIQEVVKKLGRDLLVNGREISPAKWQSIHISVPMVEVRGVYFKVDMPEALSELVESCEPNLPWADDHFRERVGGSPLNPGEQYKNWPYYRMDDKMRTEGEKFSHSYMERYWPKKAWDEDTRPINGQHVGIRYAYGDLQDVVNLLINDPMTRQAFLPVWFPEDTGVVHGKRVPCSLGYLFEIRDGKLDITYYMRSCDYMRHLRDDIYLTIRLAGWVVNKLSYALVLKGNIPTVKMGALTMAVANLHVFKSDLYTLRKQL